MSSTNVIIIFLFATLAACSPRTNEFKVEPPNNKIPTPHIQLDNSKGAFEVASRYNLYCSGEHCQQGIVSVLSLREVEGKFYIGLCTGSILPTGDVLTNAHCLDAHSLKTGSDCSGKIFIVNPRRIQKEDVINCDRVLDYRLGSSSPYDSAYDYAVLKLKKIVSDISRVKLPSVPMPVPSDTEVKIVKVDHGQTVDGFHMVRTETCQTKIEPRIDIYYLKPESPRFMMLGCDVIKGNSGSPVFLKSTNDLLGVVYSTAKVKLPQNFDEPDSQKVDYKISFATNYFCMVVENQNHPSCQHEVKEAAQ